jgi:preprotein translocase subunit SecE
MLAKIKQFYGESKQELRHVNWPARGEAVRLTIIVIGISLGLALFLGAFDFLFSYGLELFVSGRL